VNRGHPCNFSGYQQACSKDAAPLCERSCLNCCCGWWRQKDDVVICCWRLCVGHYREGYHSRIQVDGGKVYQIICAHGGIDKWRERESKFCYYLNAECFVITRSLKPRNYEFFGSSLLWLTATEYLASSGLVRSP